MMKIGISVGYYRAPLLHWIESRYILLQQVKCDKAAFLENAPRYTSCRFLCKPHEHLK